MKKNFDMEALKKLYVRPSNEQQLILDTFEELESTVPRMKKDLEELESTTKRLKTYLSQRKVQGQGTGETS